MIKDTLPVSDKTRIRRAPKRAVLQRETLYRIFDESLVAHVGFSIDHQPFVIPTLCWRIDNDLYLHGAGSSRMLKHLATGAPVSVTATLLDGLVLGKSSFHHSANYRSACVFGQFHPVTDEAQWLEAFRLFTEHIAPGRWSLIRKPSAKEIRATRLFRLPVEEASVKIRTGPPVDDKADLELPVWSGEIPVRHLFGPLKADAHTSPDQPEPDYQKAYGNRWWPA